VKILAATGDALALPCVSIADHGGTKLRLALTHVVGGLRKREEFEFTRAELRLVARAVFDALAWPED
jgi:predicted NBD/HSP70 family sugar kinase